MYSFKQQQLSQFHPIPKTVQDEITKQTAAPLDLNKAFSLIKEASDNFTKEDTLAMEADGLLTELLELQKQKNSKKQSRQLSGPNSNPDREQIHNDKSQMPIKNQKSEIHNLQFSAMQVREKERIRALALIELELSLNLKNAS